MAIVAVAPRVHVAVLGTEGRVSVTARNLHGIVDGPMCGGSTSTSAHSCVCVRVCEIQRERRRSVLDGCKVAHGSLVAMTELALRARARREHAALIRDSDRVIEATRDLHRKLILHERVSQRHQSRFTVTWHECMRRLEWYSNQSNTRMRERERATPHTCERTSRQGRVGRSRSSPRQTTLLCE